MKIPDIKSNTFKRKAKVALATGSGAVLGFIAGNVPGAIIGGKIGSVVADRVLDQDGKNKYI
jgi:hypothetical protein